MNRERPLTSKELAHYLKMTTRTVANWRKTSRIPYWPISPRSVRYRLSDVEKALESGRAFLLR
jgi:transcriptional antiterminator